MTPQMPYTMLQLKALVASGRGCSLRELRVLLSLIVRADADGEAFPSPESIAESWGMDERNVRRTLADLQSATADRPAMIETSAAGGGRSHSARRKLLFVAGETRADLAPLCDETRATETRANSTSVCELNPGQIGAETRANLAHKPGPNWPPEETIEETNEERARINIELDARQHASVVECETAGRATSAAGGFDRVDEIYAAYPRHVGKAAAVYAIKRGIVRLLKRSSTAPAGEPWGAWLLTTVRKYAAARQRSIAADPTDDRKKTPHPTTWFNQDRFDDDPAEWEPVVRKPAGSAPTPTDLNTASPGLAAAIRLQNGTTR